MPLVAAAGVPATLIRALMRAAVAARLRADPALALLPGRLADNGEKMVARFKIIGLVLLSGVTLAAGRIPASYAATSATLDILPNDVAGVPERVEVGTVKPLTAPKRDSGKLLPSGNPLWSVPLSVLTATQERPIFSASRRPPPRIVAGPRIEPEIAAPVKKPEPERPALALIGAVLGESDAIAVFLDRTNQKIVRLRAGETHLGWVLSSVLRREVTLKKDDQVEVLSLQPTEPPLNPAAMPGFATLPGQLVQPPQAVGGASFAPFVPRSTPKNGESDGL